MTAAEIKAALGSVRLKPTPVTIDKELFGEIPPFPVFVRVMSGKERASWGDACFDDKGNGIDRQSNDRLVLRTLCDEHGVRVYTDDDLALVEALPQTLTAPIAKAASRLNKLSREDEDAAKKDSTDAQKPGSGTGSPSNSA